jgi:ketosteroid isomerase-like protein
MPQSAEDVARQSVECYSSGDFDRLRSLLADDFYEEELATQRRLEGADARVETVQGWKRAFPDEQGTITGVYTSGNTVAMEITWEARTAAQWRRLTVRSCRRRTNAFR